MDIHGSKLWEESVGEYIMLPDEAVLMSLFLFFFEFSKRARRVGLEMPSGA